MGALRTSFGAGTIQQLSIVEPRTKASPPASAATSRLDPCGGRWCGQSTDAGAEDGPGGSPWRNNREERSLPRSLQWVLPTVAHRRQVLAARFLLMTAATAAVISAVPTRNSNPPTKIALFEPSTATVMNIHAVEAMNPASKALRTCAPMIPPVGSDTVGADRFIAAPVGVTLAVAPGKCRVLSGAWSPADHDLG